MLSQADTWPSAGTAWFIAVVGLIVLAVTSVRRWRRLVIVLVTTAAVLVALAATTVAIAFSVFDVSLNDGVGDRNYTPALVAQVRDRYELGHRHPGHRPLQPAGEPAGGRGRPGSASATCA